jgi:phosphoribosylglycinamide formyltransferase-1
MRILTPEFVQTFYGKILNIHPSLLPKYPGLHTHRRALAAKDQEHGISIHFVTSDLDSGPIIAQAKLAVSPQDTEVTLKQRIQLLEYQLYPLVLQWFATGKIYLADNQVYLDNQKLTAQGCIVKFDNF